MTTEITFDSQDVNRPLPAGLTAIPTGVHPPLSRVEAAEVYALSDGTYIVVSPFHIDQASQRFTGVESDEVALWWTDEEGTPLMSDDPEDVLGALVMGTVPILYAGATLGTLDPVEALRQAGVEVTA